MAYLNPSFFSASLPATNTPDAHTAKGFAKHHVYMDYRSLLLLNWLLWNLLSESKHIAAASKPQLLVGTPGTSTTMTIAPKSSLHLTGLPLCSVFLRVCGCCYSWSSFTALFIPCTLCSQCTGGRFQGCGFVPQFTVGDY